jgi:hypothetical protein
VYRYGDPGKCQCVYMGGVEEYETYKRYLNQRNIPQEYQLEAGDGDRRAGASLRYLGPLVVVTCVARSVVLCGSHRHEAA